MKHPWLRRLCHPFAIDLEMLAVFRVLLALIVLWGLVGRVSIRDYLFSLSPEVGRTLASAGEQASGDQSSELGPAEPRESVDSESATVQPVLFDSRDSRSVWTPWHWSVLWLDQVLERIRTTLLAVQPVVSVDALDDPLDPADATPTRPVYARWQAPLAEAQDFFASRLWFDCVLGVGIASAILFGCGLFTKAANVSLWIVLVSLQHRLPLFNSGGDSLERLFLFWLLFLPAGAVFSLDALWFPRQGFWRKRLNQSRLQRLQASALRGPGDSFPRHHAICSWATAALLIQLVAIYVYSALEKLHADWWQGTAVATALQWEFIAKPLAGTLLEFPLLLRGVTWSVLLMELLCPLLVFCPYLFGWTRKFTLYFFVGMHLGIAATLSIGTFSAVCIVGWLLFLPWSTPTSAATWAGWWRDDRDTAQPLPHSVPGSSRADATAGECLVVVLVGLTVWWNLTHVSWLQSWLKFPVQLQPIVCQLGLDPNFPMFGRVPHHNYGWQHRVELETGQSRDIRPELPPPLNVPNRITTWTESHGIYLWRQLHVNLLYLEGEQPDFVWQVRDQLRILELETWKQRGQSAPGPMTTPDALDADKMLRSELLLIDRTTQDERNWSITDL
jgi:hypothetical protein